MTIAIAGLFHPPSAFAQLQPEAPVGSRIAVPPVDFPVEQTRNVLTRFGTCMVRTNPALAREFILSDQSYTFTRKWQPLWGGSCYEQAIAGQVAGEPTLIMTMGVVHYVIADALVTKDLASYSPTAISLAAPLAPPKFDWSLFNPKSTSSSSQRARLAQGRARAEADVAMIAYGECVVRADPTGSKRLLAAPINSDEELAALREMVPAFSSCLDRGQQFKGDRLRLRGTVALNYYRLAYAPKLPRPDAKAQ